MITVTTTQNQFELRLKFSTNWIKRTVLFIAELLSFDEVREIERRKQKELHEMGMHFYKVIF